MPKRIYFTNARKSNWSKQLKQLWNEHSIKWLTNTGGLKLENNSQTIENKAKRKHIKNRVQRKEYEELKVIKILRTQNMGNITENSKDREWRMADLGYRYTIEEWIHLSGSAV